MSAMKCFGYYIVKPLEKPEWLNLEAIHILSVGSGLSDTFPDLAKCFWTNYPESDRIQYKKKLPKNKLAEDRKQLVIDNNIIKKGIGKIRSLFVFIFNIAIIKLNFKPKNMD